MGRGLSDLQKFILKAAAAKPEGTLYNYEICMGYYRWKPNRRNPGAAENNFLPAEIGENKYNSAFVAIRKAYLRMEKRGLVRCVYSWQRRSWAGVDITDRGRQIVKTMPESTII